MGSMDTLVDDLLRKPQDSFRDELVRRALAGAYHDFKSEHPTPKVALIGDLVHYGYRDLARKARSGAYDDAADGDDEARMQGFIAQHPELGDLDRRLRAGELTYEQAALEAMKTLSPADQIRAAVELDITRTEKPDEP